MPLYFKRPNTAVLPSTTTTLALTDTAKVTFIKFYLAIKEFFGFLGKMIFYHKSDFMVKQYGCIVLNPKQICRCSSSNFCNKKLKAVLTVIFYLIYNELASYLQYSICANLRQPPIFKRQSRPRQLQLGATQRATV